MRLTCVASALLLACSSQPASNPAKSPQAGASGTGDGGGASGQSSTPSAGAGAAATAGAAAGATSGGAGNSSSAGSGGAKPFEPPKCAAENSKLPDNAPVLETGVWKKITPPGLPSGSFAQGIALDPCNPATLYATFSGYNDAGNVNAGLFRTTDAGTTWRELGVFEQALNIRVDPRDPLHLYVGDGVRGGTNGFWVSKDGGATWFMPDGFKKMADSLQDYDVYHVEPDPADFNHVLVTFHYYWNGGLNAGIIESFDEGATWIKHEPDPGWEGTGGYNVFFLYEPAQGIGDNKTWLYGTQGNGYWRTKDAGTTWTKVTDVDMQHGGGTLYYTSKGVLYTGGNPHALRSTDNGVTWTELSVFGGFLSVKGDGTRLYAGSIIGPIPILSALESDDSTWTPSTQMFEGGPFEMAYDKANHRMYAGMTAEGIWVLKTAD